MSYKILEATVENDAIRTRVEFVYSDGTKEEIDVFHFQPTAKESVLQGLANREASNEVALAAKKRNELIVAELSKSIVRE